MSTTIQLTFQKGYRVDRSGIVQEESTPYNNRINLNNQPSYYWIAIWEIPNSVRHKRINLNNIDIESSSYDPATNHFEAFVVDNLLENIATTGNELNLNDSNPILQTMHTSQLSVSYPTNPSGSSGGTTYTYASTSLYIGTGKYLVLTGGRDTIVSMKQLIAINITAEVDETIIDNIVPTYPSNINIKNNIAHTFLWQNEPRIDQQYLGDTVYYLPCTSHSVEYRKVGGSSVTLSMTDSNYYQEIPANTFDIDHYEYRVHFYSYDSYELVTSWTPFNAIGQNAAPTINSVTNNAIPTIAWTDQNQAAFEIRIKDSNQQIIYQSGFIAGTAQSYRINQMLSNGSYTVEVRELNIYGLYSDWGSYYFTINPTAVTAPTNIFATVNNKYGVEISGTPVSGATKTYVVRREHGSDDIEIIGIYTGGIYVDYTAKANVFYEYTLRNYKNAYADGEWVPLQVVVDKVLIQDGRDRENFIKLTLSEDATFDVNWTEEVDRTLYSCLGRKYPVKEPGEWVNSIRTFTAYVDNMDKLQDMNLHAHKVYLKSYKEYFAADMTIEDKGSYVGGGRIVAFTLTRIADDEGIILL